MNPKSSLPPVGIRGLTAVPKPGGTGEVLWFAALSKARRLDPADGFKETIELGIPMFLRGKLGVKVTLALSAYNELMPYKVPGTGETLWMFGLECSHPAAVVNSHPRIKARVQVKEKTRRAYFAGEARYCIRRAQGTNITYELAEVTAPREPQLVSTRVIAVSPFLENQGKAFYFAGYDCNSVPSHNTAWIYRGELP